MPQSFTEKVYRIVRRIPRGRVMTYVAVARAAGSPRAYRAVGNIMNRNPFASVRLPANRRVPCHRVIRSDGYVGGYAHGTKKKIEILGREGVEILRGHVLLKRTQK